MIGGEQVADLEGRRALVYVGGSIAAVKAGEVITLLRRRGAETRVAMTPSATHFITPLSLQSLSGHPVVSDLFREATGVSRGVEGHLRRERGGRPWHGAPESLRMGRGAARGRPPRPT